ncbi:PKD domain-containing protein [bacterium]|nr:PKD domain-containing protein [bacterium]
MDIAGRGVEYSKGKRGVRSALWLSAAALAVILAFAACGKGKLPAGSGILPGPSSALTQLEKLPCPEGVEVTLWDELKEALKEALAKAASMPPTGATNRIDDLACSLNGDGTYTLTWHYRNLGDYDQSGIVGISDITPLAIHFGEDTAPENEWIDGDSDGRVHISDITPIAMYFGANVHHYSIQGSHFFSSQFIEVAQLVFPESTPNDARFAFEQSLGAEPEYLYWRIVPVDDEGNPGDASNVAQVSAAPPPAVRILSVNPLGGVTGTEVTFSAVISGEAPFDYEWDFGGGATPNQPSGISDQVSAQVTLGAVDAYDASLSVENAEGSAVKHFTLTVTAEPGEPPEIVSVSPTEGDSGTEATFTAEVTGDGPFTYYWDFGGGASPNQSSGVSDQPSATVTLSRGGTLPEPVVTYPASLTVTNPYGMSTHDFALNISAWWHVEELPQYGSPDDYVSIQSVAFAPSGTFWVALELDETPDGPGGRSVRVASLQNNTWDTHLIMDQPPAGRASLAIDSKGNPALSYSKGSLGGELWYAHWSEDEWKYEYVAPGGIFSPTSTLLLDSTNKPVIAFSTIHSDDPTRRFTVVRRIANTWHILLEGDIYALPSGPISIGPADKVHIVDTVNDDLAYTVETINGWANEVLKEGFDEPEGFHLFFVKDISVTPQGDVLIPFKEAVGPRDLGGPPKEQWLWLAKKTGMDWEYSLIDSGVGRYFGVRTVITHADTEVVSYIDYQDPDISEDDHYYYAWNDCGTWIAEPSPIPGELITHPNDIPTLLAGKTTLAMYW